MVTNDSIEFRPGQIKEICSTDAGGEKRIIFFETSGERCLRPRQACAIESAALANPDMSVYVHMTLEKPRGNPEVDQGEGLERHCQTLETLNSYPNVYVIREDLTKHLIGTPLELFSSSGNLLDESKFANQQLSDALRIALLYKLGGIYLDLDTIVLRSFRCLRNTVGQVFALGKSSVENSALIFDSGHPFLFYLMNVMKEVYDPNYRESIGPHAMTKAFRSMCNHTSEVIDNYKHDFKCPDDRVRINMLNYTAFFPFDFDHRQLYYLETFSPEMLSLFESAYSIHFFMSGHGTSVPQTSFYAYIAKRFCPLVYRHHELRTYQF